jgi:hypothetical protein
MLLTMPKLDAFFEAQRDGGCDAGRGLKVGVKSGRGGGFRGFRGCIKWRNVPRNSVAKIGLIEYSSFQS